MENSEKDLESSEISKGCRSGKYRDTSRGKRNAGGLATVGRWPAKLPAMPAEDGPTGRSRY